MKYTYHEVPPMPITEIGLQVMPTSTSTLDSTMPKSPRRELAAGEDADCTLLQH